MSSTCNVNDVEAAKGAGGSGCSGDTSDVSDNGTADEAAKSGDESGDVYDFKDPKTSGAVTVIKQWDDSLTNEERPVPDISISTEKPSKSTLGYTVTYHGNGLTFEDGSDTNEIVVNSSGKIVSGQYKVPAGTSVTWYSDVNSTNKVELSAEGIPEGLGGDMDLYAKEKTYVLKGFGYYESKWENIFNSLIPDTATAVVFTDEAMPADATLIDVDADGDGGVVAWMDGTAMKVSTQVPGKKVVAAADCTRMFSYKSNLTSIDLSNLDTSKVTNMRFMFDGCSGLTKLDLTSLDTSKVSDMYYMFASCSGLTKLNLDSLDTDNVTNMGYMFYNCSGLAELNLTPLKTSKVTFMGSMFNGCYSLTELNLSHLDTGNVTNMSCMFTACKSLTKLDLSPLNTSRVTDMGEMFEGCQGLTELDLSSLDTSKVTDMYRMFADCSGLTELDLTHLDTSNVTSMVYIFDGCSNLATLTLGDKFTFVGTDYYLPSGTWYAADGTAYTSNGESCTIPNNTADTYTRR